MQRVRTRRGGLASLSGLLAGTLAGVTAVTLVAIAGAQRTSEVAAAPSLEVSHVPPLLTVRDEPVELRYDVYCVAEGDPEAPCDVDGAVFARAGDREAFTELAVEVREQVEDGRIVAVVPPSLARSPAGVSYYAVFSSERLGTSIVIPAGGPEAPQRSISLERGVEVDLPAHAFGRTRRADARVAQAAWGGAGYEVGLEPAPSQTPIGASSFDVGDDGTVHLLDQAKGRVLRFSPGASRPTPVAIGVNRAIADLSVGDGGTLHVLETTPDARGRTLLRAFAPDGSERSTTPVAERASQVRVGAGGEPFVLQHPSGQWMAAAERGRSLGAGGQRRSGRPGRPLREGGEVVVLRVANEIRVALLGTNGVRRSWRVRSETPLAEVQLAEPAGNGLVLVVRTYSETDDEFLALVLGPRGLVASYSLASADWAETAPLSRFRLRGSSLYQLGSTRGGVFVDRFDLEVQ